MATSPERGGAASRNPSGLACLIDWVYVILIAVFVPAVTVLSGKACGQFRAASSAPAEVLAGQRRSLELSGRVIEDGEEVRPILAEIRDLLTER